MYSIFHLNKFQASKLQLFFELDKQTLQKLRLLFHKRAIITMSFGSTLRLRNL